MEERQKGGQVGMKRTAMLDLSVGKVNKRTNTWQRLYEGISTFEEADLLAQLAMTEKEVDELIVIMPGWNRGIKNYPPIHQRSMLLAEKYKCFSNT